MANIATPKEKTVSVGRFTELTLGEIVCDQNIRSEEPSFESDEGADLVASIKEYGVLEPVIVIVGQDGKYHLRAGYRRHAALRKVAEIAGRPWASEKIPAMAYTVDEMRAKEMALVENLQRKAMNPLDRAIAFSQLIEETGCEQREIARRLGVTSASISQHRALLRFPEAVKNKIKTGRLNFTLARALTRLKSPELIASLSEEVEVKRLGVQQTEQRVVEILERKTSRLGAAQNSAQPKRPRRTPGKAERVEAAVGPAIMRTTQMKEATLKVMSEPSVRSLLVTWARRVDGARSRERKREYELVLYGLGLAAGLDFKASRKARPPSDLRR